MGLKNLTYPAIGKVINDLTYFLQKGELLDLTSIA
jgi:hypothetical protein